MIDAGAYLEEAIAILADLDETQVERVALRVKAANRVYFLGVGGSAATCSHAVNDFRKILGKPAYAVTDNVAELTARTNDDGWDSTFEGWLRTEELAKDDLVFVVSVGGGRGNVSPNIVRAIDYASTHEVPIVAVVGRDGGHTGVVADEVVLIPPLFPERVTSHTEGIAVVIMHLLVELCRTS